MIKKCSKCGKPLGKAGRKPKTMEFSIKIPTESQQEHADDNEMRYKPNGEPDMTMSNYIDEMQVIGSAIEREFAGSKVKIIVQRVTKKWLIV